MSVAVPVNWQGMKIVSATDLTPIDNKKTSSIPSPFTFPNGTPCPAGTTIDRYGRYRVNGSPGVNMSADGEAFGGLNAPVSYVQAALNREQGFTPLQRDDNVKEYTLFIRDYIPGGPDDAIAQAWANRAAAVNYTDATGTYNYSGITLNHVKADATQINQVKYNTTMHQF